MKTKTKVITIITALMLSCVLVFTIVLANHTNKMASMEANIRTIVLNNNTVDYASFFNEFEDAELEIDEANNALKFSGTKTIEADLLKDMDLISLTDDECGVDVRYIFDYNANKNEFYLSVIADTENGEIIDNWLGVPFVTESEEIDIAFATDDGVVFLSELKESGVLENCGWLSWLWKAAVAVAVVAIVVAVVIVAAPAVAAAATAVATAVSVGGGAAAMTAGTATAAVAAAAAAAAVGSAAMATAAFAVVTTTAVVAAATAVTAAVADAIATRVYYNIQEKVEAARKELQKRRPNDTIIYRMGSDTYYNLTPRPVDVNGLSFYSGIYFGRCVITTKELVDMTGVLRANGDNHILVNPVAGDIGAWIATKPTADINPHPYTKALKQIVIKI